MAVGKMTVGQSLQKKLNYDLLYNHQSIEFTLAYYDYDSPGFGKINEGIRKLLFKTIAEDETKQGFIFTCVWAFDQESDWKYIDKIDRLFGDNGWTTRYIELIASLETRLQRNATPHRLRHKPSKNDLRMSRDSMLKMEEGLRLVSEPDELTMKHYLRINNEDLSPDQVANKIIHFFKLDKLDH